MEWKRPLLIGIGWGLGTAFGFAVLVCGFIWFQSRPKPVKPWNTLAIVGKEAPGFGPSSNHKEIEFTYSLENHTSVDYQIESDSEVKLMFRNKDGTLSRPIPSELRHLRLPIFIPANQKAILAFSLTVPGIPERKTSETDDQYHERLRAYCEDHLGGVASFVVFDPANRYQVNLPRWLAEPPKKP